MFTSLRKWIDGLLHPMFFFSSAFFYVGGLIAMLVRAAPGAA